jgi:microcystin-dependent protein
MNSMTGAIDFRHAALTCALLGASLGVVSTAKAQATDPYLGEIIYMANNFCPRGWAEANGQLVSISQEQALFSLLGTMYGGNGQTNFALPDLRGRVPVHAGQGIGLSAISQGESGGSEHEQLSFAQMPAHSHTATTSAADIQVTSTLRASTSGATTKSPAGGALAVAKQPTYASGSPTASMAGGSVQSTVTGTLTTTVDATNSGTDKVPVRDPYVGIKACIAMVGVFPSRP